MWNDNHLTGLDRFRPRTYPLREIVNGLLYQLRGGIAWRAMPNDFPPWTDIYDHFRRWKKNGKFETTRPQYPAAWPGSGWP